MEAICEIYSRMPFAFQTELPPLRGSFTKEVPYVSRQSGMLDYMVKTRTHGTLTNLCHKFGNCFLRRYPWCPSPYCPTTLPPDEAESDLAPEGTAGTRDLWGACADVRSGQRRQTVPPDHLYAPAIV